MAAASTWIDPQQWSVERRRAELFHCMLAEQPHYLVPSRLLREVPEASAGDLVVNPNCWFSWQGPPGRDIARALPMPVKLRQDLDMIWVFDSELQTARPFWIGPRFRSLLSELRPGEPAPELRKGVRRLLCLAGVLVSARAKRQEGNAWRATRSRCAAQWQEQGYTAAEHLLHPFHLGSLRRYYRHLLRTGGMTLGDSGSARRYVAHNESVATFFHRQLTHVMSQIAGVPVKPSYVYVSCYQNSAELPSHTDRMQCEYSITMLIDQTPEPNGRSSWPLYLEAQGGRVGIRQHIGEALFYRGREIPHYRTRLPEGMTSTSIFFHYVDINFAHSLD